MECLERVLVAYTRQTMLPAEFIVADDGSTDDTEAMVQRLAGEMPFPLGYVRHENEGFRKAATVNMGVRAAGEDYLFVTDCDSLPHADLLARHVAHAAPNRLVLGECVRLTEAFTNALDMDAVRGGRYEEARDPKTQKLLDSRQRRALFYRWTRLRRKPRIRGNNFSLSMESFRRVNGYDERFVGWGNEDGDLRERLKRIGVRPYPIVNQAVNYHMWHPLHETKSTLPNREYAWSGHGRPARCEVGLDRVPAGTGS